MMSGITHMVISLFTSGLVEGLRLIWLKAWLLAFTVAYPAVLAVARWPSAWLTSRLASRVFRLEASRSVASIW